MGSPSPAPCRQPGRTVLVTSFDASMDMRGVRHARLRPRTPPWPPPKAISDTAAGRHAGYVLPVCGAGGLCAFPRRSRDRDGAARRLSSRRRGLLRTLQPSSAVAERRQRSFLGTWRPRGGWPGAQTLRLAARKRELFSSTTPIPQVHPNKSTLSPTSQLTSPLINKSYARTCATPKKSPHTRVVRTLQRVDVVPCLLCSIWRCLSPLLAACTCRRSARRPARLPLARPSLPLRRQHARCGAIQEDSHIFVSRLV